MEETDVPSYNLGISDNVSSALACWKGVLYFITLHYCPVSTGSLPTGLAILINSASTSLVLTASLLEETNLFYNRAPSCLSSGINRQPANLPDVFSISAPTVCTTTVENPHTAKPDVFANSVHAWCLRSLLVNFLTERLLPKKACPILWQCICWVGGSTLQATIHLN